MLPRLARILAIAACAAFLVGCNGGTVDRHALTNDAATVDSIACEGALLAHDVAQGKTTANYTREQAEELAIQSSNLADALAKRPALPSIERQGASEGEGCREARGDAAPPARPSVRSRRRGDGRTAAGQARELPVNKVLGLALGILAAIGGFVDIGDLVFNTAAGATFGYQLDVGDPDRRRRDHRLLGDVRPCGRCVGQGGLRRDPRAGRLQGRARRARLVGGRQSDDARLRDRRRRDRVAASLGASVPLADPDRRDRVRA